VEHRMGNAASEVPSRQCGHDGAHASASKARRSGGPRGMAEQREAPLCFFALGDWGKRCPVVKQLAAQMATCAQRMNPQLILALGDNFYPVGVKSVDDPQFRTVWQEIFLIHKELRVPWKVCLGNHDYYGNPQAQIDFTNSPLNPHGLWQCEGQNYTFTAALADGGSVDFFALDTNGCQESVRYFHPDLQEALKEYVHELDKKLQQSTATWKVVFAHHPIYTKGVKHGVLGRILRNDTYKMQGVEEVQEGYGLEKVLVTSGASAYFSGHEHVLQQHSAGSVGHFVCGGSGAEGIGFYGGEDMRPRSNHPSWVDGCSSNRSQTASPGFAVCVADSRSLTVAFINIYGQVLRAVRRLAHQAGEWEVLANPSAALEAALAGNGDAHQPVA